MNATATRRVLLVDDRPEVIEAVKTQLEGFDVQTASNMDSAKDFLRSGEYGAVLCDSGLGGSDRLRELLMADSRMTGLLVGAPPAACGGSAEPVVFQPGSRARLDLAALKVYLQQPACKPEDARCVDVLRQQILDAVSRAPSAGSQTDILEAIARTTGACYAAFLRKAEGGARVLCECMKRPGGGGHRPAALASFGPEPGLGLTKVGPTLWVWYSTSDGHALAVAYDRPSKGRLTAFAECAPAAAAILRDHPWGADVSGSCLLELSAFNAVIHETRDAVTGLMLCLAAQKKIWPSGGLAEAAALPLLDGHLARLVELCKEYAWLDSATRPNARLWRTDAMLESCADLIRALGMSVASVEIDAPFQLQRSRHLTAARVLLHVCMAMLRLRASRVRLRCFRGAGGHVIEVSFASPCADPSGPLADVCRFAGELGAASTLKAAKGRVVLEIAFASNEEKVELTDC